MANGGHRITSAQQIQELNRSVLVMEVKTLDFLLFQRLKFLIKILGGPFVVEVADGRRVVMGIVSVTVIECAQGVPGAFLGLDAYLPWINGVMDGTWTDAAPQSVVMSMVVFIGSILTVFAAK